MSNFDFYQQTVREIGTQLTTCLIIVQHNNKKKKIVFKKNSQSIEVGLRSEEMGTGKSVSF